MSWTVVLLGGTAIACEPDRAAAGTSEAPAGVSAPKATRQPPRELSGTLVDESGFPVSRAYIHFVEQDVWRGARTDASGRFRITENSADSQLLLAWSQRSGRMAVIPIADKMPGDRRYVLDCREASVEGRVVDRQNRVVEGIGITLQITGPRGISFSKSHGPKTNAEGEFGAGMLPAGPGWTVRAVLASGETTADIAMTSRSVVELPDLVLTAPAGPAANEAPQMAVYSGQIVDEDGAPIDGVSIEFHGDDMGDGTLTGPDGRWSRRMRADLPAFEMRLDHPEFIGWEFDLRQPTPSREALLDGSAIQIMKRGLRIHGRVRDPSGAPVGNALVLAGESYTRTPGPESEPIEDSTAVRTARDGTFSVSGIPAGLRHVVVLAEGYAPGRIAVAVKGETKPLEFVLDRGRTVSGRIIDEAGNPLPNIRVGAEDWTMPNSWRHPLARVVSTDSDGRFSIPALPREGLIQAYAHSGNRDQRLNMSFEIVPGIADVGDVRLYSNPIIGGRVVDDETGLPIRRFLVAEGYFDDEGQFIPSREPVTLDSRSAEFERKINWMILSRDRDTSFAAKIAASGYASVITPPIVPGEPQKRFEIRLRRAAPLRGTVETPDGDPAAGAKVCSVGPHNDAWVRGTDLDHHLTYMPDERTVAAEDGTFEIAPQSEAGRLLILHPAGYAVVPTQDFHPGQHLKLVPWARIEGTYRPGGQPKLAALISAEAIRPRAAMTSRDRLKFSLSVTTDEEGRFVIEHVPAMQLRIGAHVTFGFGAEKRVEVEPGRTHVVTLADDGPVVRGKADLSEVIAAHPPVPGLAFDTSTSWVRAVRVLPRPELPKGVDAADWNSQIQSVVDGRPEDDLTLPAAFAELNTDGSFTFDSLAPGKYVLLVEIHGERPPNTCGWGLMLARGRAEFTVAAQPITLPELKLQAPSHPKAGDAAPEITGTAAAGAPFTLSGLRGKYVVLDFWAGWCSPCRASQPALQSLHAQYKDQVTFVGLNFDYTPEKARKAIAAIDSPWLHVLSGPWGTSNQTLSAYGIEVIPSIWLLDPAGKVIASHLTPDALEKRLAEFIKEP